MRTANAERGGGGGGGESDMVLVLGFTEKKRGLRGNCLMENRRKIEEGLR